MKGKKKLYQKIGEILGIEREDKPKKNEVRAKECFQYLNLNSKWAQGYNWIMKTSF